MQIRWLCLLSSVSFLLFLLCRMRYFSYSHAVNRLKSFIVRLNTISNKAVTKDCLPAMQPRHNTTIKWGILYLLLFWIALVCLDNNFLLSLHLYSCQTAPHTILYLPFEQFIYSRALEITMAGTHQREADCSNRDSMVAYTKWEQWYSIS